VGTRCADHVTPLYPQKLALTSPTGGGRSVGIIRVRTKATEFLYKYYPVSTCMHSTHSKWCLDLVVPHDRLLTKLASSGVDSRVVVWVRECMSYTKGKDYEGSHPRKSK